MRWKTLPLVVCLAIGAILAACGPTPEPKDITQTPDSKYIIECDAELLVNANVWLDENANGIWDEGEEPLPGVTVNAVGVSATSDAQGVAAPRSMIPCEIEPFKIFVEVPPGYRLTTASWVPSSWDGPEGIQFGFIRDDSTATPTP